MPNKCIICTHIKRLEIDREIVKGGNLAKIAQFFGVPYYSLYNHASDHVSRQLSQAWEKKELEENFDLLSKIDGIISKTEIIFQRNYNAKKDGLALKALDSQRNTIELLAKISYSLHQAKLTELEILKAKTGEKDVEAQELYLQSLKRLTIPELKVLQRLVAKANNETDEVIIPDQAILKRRRRKKVTSNVNT